MIDYNRIKFDGRVNSINGIRYRYSSSKNSITFYGVSILVTTVRCKKKSIKVTMHPDVNHERPHVHVGEHDASFDIKDGSLIVGQCNSKTRKDVQKWINEHSDDLLELWNIIKDGKPYEELVSKINNESKNKDDKQIPLPNGR